ncbi:succinate dehydrogenase assembly factor 2 [Thioclava sp. 'Guangxiensis']|uniref:FAD assembly factor SdhE n=1 Tax=Thioclava TaxID=285107 RepID=UPI003878400D
MTGQVQETAEARLKRMTMRSWRRGMKEMDMVLGPFADSELAKMDPATLDLYDALLEEYDQDLYLWVSGAKPCPPEYLQLLQVIAAFAKKRHAVE